MKPHWDTKDMPSLDGRLALVTGANRGLGLILAAELARKGAHVLLACRDAGRAQEALAHVRQQAPSARAEVLPLDLSDLADVRRFAGEFCARHARLDILVNNAAAIMVPLARTRDGFETHVGVNHLGHFALTGLLLPALRAAPGARVVNSGSLAHKLTGGFDFDDPHFERSPYKEMDAYGRSKLAAIVHAIELDRRVRRAGLPLLATVAHPGYSNTNPDKGGFMLRLLTRLIAQPAAAGALPALFAATAPGVEGGDYVGPAGFKELKGPPKRVQCRPEARDPELGARLWQWSEKLTGVSYAF